MLTSQVPADMIREMPKDVFNGHETFHVMNFMARDIYINANAVISHDEEEREYYHMFNPFNTDFERYKNGDEYALHRNFTCNAPQVIEAIRGGYADTFIGIPGPRSAFDESMTLKVMSVATRFPVLRFIDHEYGEKIRQKNIHNFEGAEYTYGLSFAGPTIGTMYVTYDMVGKDLPSRSTTNFYKGTSEEVDAMRDNLIEQLKYIARDDYAGDPAFEIFASVLKERIRHTWFKEDYDKDDPESCAKFLGGIITKTMLLKN